MTARQLAPEADLATVLQLATDALQRGTMLDPEELLCQLLGLDPAQLLEHLEDLDDFPPLVWETDPELRPPDRSPPASRARAREETWRVAEAGRLAHLLELGRPLCGATDPGPWRAVAGAVRCAACVDLSEVLARHG